MKKICYVLSIILVAICLTGCQEKEKNVEGSLPSIMDKLYANINEEDLPKLANTELNDENIENFIGTKDIKYKEALASEPLIGSIAHSVILIRANDVNDVSDIKAEIKAKVNPQKWVCVGVPLEDVVIDSKGDLIIVIISESYKDQIYDAFKAL